MFSSSNWLVPQPASARLNQRWPLPWCISFQEVCVKVVVVVCVWCHGHWYDQSKTDSQKFCFNYIDDIYHCCTDTGISIRIGADTHGSVLVLAVIEH